MSIEVKEITKLYGSQKALNNISFQIDAGEIVGFLGPNGAGKSTMMKILTCYIPPGAGTAKVCGFDVQDEFGEVKKRVGYLPETNPLYLDMYVKEYLEFVAGIHQLGAKSKSRISEMIALTGLEIERNKKIGQLSKGYKQRVGLAGALMHNPEVLILDEPTSGLDPNQLVEIRELIRASGKEKTVMLSTHIMQEVEAVCSRVIIIDQGQIVADGSVQELSGASSGQLVVQVEFNQAINIKLLESLEGVRSVDHSGLNAYRVTAAAGMDVRPALFDFAVKSGVSVISLQKEPQRLENVFRALTKKT